MLMDGRPVFNVTCYDHINLSSVLIDITLLPLRLSQSITQCCKFDLKWQRATTLHKPTISLLQFVFLLSSTLYVRLPLFNPPYFDTCLFYF